ncbi:hypothetical protein CBI36_10910 [Acetobacter oryzifermentans]|uniref:Uncharacterized protein n=1 Tax=Acetobacter oryzifermentans TaxID=1633874 RepID=A0ABC8CEW9_9PROT|nr:hypothetical protein CBI36_10910 [Acetobacter oryzifermentans]
MLPRDVPQPVRLVSGAGLAASFVPQSLLQNLIIPYAEKILIQKPLFLWRDCPRNYVQVLIPNGKSHLHGWLFYV